MYAIIKTGGKQYKVRKGDVVDVELLGLELGSPVEFSDVLFFFNGTDHKVGAPAIDGVTVKGEVVAETAGPKVQSITYKQRKRQKHKFGHRQHYSRVKINEISQV